MAYAQPFLRLVVSGTLHTAETFSYGLTLIQDFGGANPPNEVPESVIDAVTAFHQASHVSHNQARVTTIKLNEIGTDGRYTNDGDTVLHDFAEPVPGLTTYAYPPQIALAITLRTGATRGRASSGRFYVPSAAPIGSDGRITVQARDSIVTAATAFIQSLNSAVPGYDVGVASNVGLGAQRAVIGVRVGRVLDTMRSRRRSLEEDYGIGPDIDGGLGEG